MSELSPDIKEFVDSEIANGNFTDQEAVVEYALRLMQRDREEAVRGIAAGLADVAAGRVEPLQEAFDGLRNEFGIAKDA